MSLNDILNSKTIGNRVCGIFFICFSLIFLYIGIVKTINRYHFTVRALRIIGDVVEIKSRHVITPTGGVIIVFTPVIRFTNANGETYDFRAIEEESPKHFFQLDQKVTLLIDPLNQEPIYLDKFDSVWLDCIVIICPSGLFLLFGIFLLLRPSINFPLNKDKTYFT